MNLLSRLRWRNWRLTFKLAVTVATLVALVAACTTVLAISREQRTYRAELEQQAKLLLDTLERALTEPLYIMDVAKLNDEIGGLGEGQLVVSGRVYDKMGRVVADAYDAEMGYRLPVDPLGQRLVQSDATIFEWQSDQLVAGKAVVVGHEAAGAISVGLPTAPLGAKLAAVRVQGLAIALATTVVGIALALLVSRSITRPLREMVGVTRRVAEGDLSQKITIRGGDEVAVMGEAFNQMIVRLREMLHDEQEQREYLQAAVQRCVAYLAEVARGNLSIQMALEEAGRGANDPLLELGHNLNEATASLQRMTLQIRDAASDLSSASSEILATTTQQASGAGEQSAAIAQASSTIDEVRANAEQTSQQTQAVAEIAQRTAEVSQAGQRAVAESIDGMQEVKRKVETITANIQALSEQTQAIGVIIATVDQIAKQSNLLSLNAAVEAARAGEAGRGFAVVAGEVRNLAERSRVATVQVKEILSEIQRRVDAAVMATEEGRKGTDVGVQLAREAGETIRQLAENVDGSARAAAQITAAAGQQVAGMEQIARAMQSIQQVTVQTADGTRQSERAAEELNVLAGHLRELVEPYRL